MSRLLIAVLLLVTALPSQAAETRRFYDRDGHPTGRAETEGRTTRFYDSAGHPTGRAETDGRGMVRTYDSRGHPTGTAR